MKFSILVMTALVVMTAPRPANTAPKNDVYHVKGLVSDLHRGAEHFDPNLVNPWGIASSPTGPFWIADNGTGVSTLYDTSGSFFPVGNRLSVTVPTPGTPPSAP